jgi:tetratricopeptide (TPR) repeat protein
VASAYAALERYSEAVGEYEAAVRLANGATRLLYWTRQGLASAYAGLADAHLSEGRREEAIIAIERAVASNPNHPSTRVRQARFYMKIGRLEDAERALKVAIGFCNEPDATFAEVRRNHALLTDLERSSALHALLELYEAAGRWTDAVAILRERAIRGLTDSDRHFRLGRAYLRSGDKESAQAEYKILKDLDAARAADLMALIGE